MMETANQAVFFENLAIHRVNKTCVSDTDM